MKLSTSVSTERWTRTTRVASSHRTKRFGICSSRANVAILSTKSARLKKFKLHPPTFYFVFSCPVSVLAILSVVPQFSPPSFQQGGTFSVDFDGLSLPCFVLLSRYFNGAGKPLNSSSIRVKCRTNRPGSTAKTINPVVTSKICRISERRNEEMRQQENEQKKSRKLEKVFRLVARAFYLRLDRRAIRITNSVLE